MKNIKPTEDDQFSAIPSQGANIDDTRHAAVRASQVILQSREGRGTASFDQSDEKDKVQPTKGRLRRCLTAISFRHVRVRLEFELLPFREKSSKNDSGADFF